MHLCQNKRRLRVFYHIVDSIFWVGWIYREKLKNINIVSEKEKHWLLDECNNTKKDYPREKTIQDRILENKNQIQ
jgi:hypothetical protein